MTFHPHCCHETMGWHRFCSFKRVGTEPKKGKKKYPYGNKRGKEHFPEDTEKANIQKWLSMGSRWRPKETSAWWHLKYGVDRNHGREATWASLYKSSLFSKSLSNEQKNIKAEGKYSIFDGKYGKMPSICQKHQGWGTMLNEGNVEFLTNLF